MNAIEVRSVTKAYRMGVGRARVREMLPWPFDATLARLFPKWWWKNTFTALDDVTIAAPRGSALGLIGPNGAGKTTLLRVISGVTAPTSGSVAVSGRVAALLDVLVGFHPELTGRENILLVGSMSGFGRREMEGRTDQIIEFAEVGDFADTPVKRFSAGMLSRLGFAIMVSLGPDVLLIDEILSVGDASYQRKCIAWLDDYRSAGGTLVVVSHNQTLMRHMTDRVVWLERGRVVADGDPPDVLGKYAQASEHREAEGPARLRSAARMMRSRGLRRWGTGGARLESVAVDGPSGDVRGVMVTMRYIADSVHEAAFCVGFADEWGSEIGAAASSVLPLAHDQGHVQCLIEPLPLWSGVYFPVAAIVARDGSILDRWQLDRPIAIDRDGDGTIAEAFGPVEIGAEWLPHDPGAEA
jgi:ABC-type polysaccharide/polyol phosphate transport system ATPase subunit